MIGIYQDNFVEYLKDRLGYTKVSAKNIITKCPWCEYQKTKNHYHMYISLEAPIFHCFHANCEEHGTLRKFLKRLEGHDISETFVSRKQFDEIKKKKEIFIDKENETINIVLPKLDKKRWVGKELYIKKRMKFSSIPSTNIKGLIYDVEQFLEINRIPITETIFKLKDYLQNNFVGFLTENNSTVIFRNVDHTHNMSFFKLKIQQTNFLDYYKLPGNSPQSNKIVLAEGIFDIFSEHIYDSLNIKNDVYLYASALSSKYLSLIQSIIFHEQIFQPEVIILSDRGIKRKYYKTMKHFNKHIINKLTVYYNKTGKDFNDTPVIPIKFVM